MAGNRQAGHAHRWAPSAGLPRRAIAGGRRAAGLWERERGGQNRAGRRLALRAARCDAMISTNTQHGKATMAIGYHKINTSAARSKRIATSYAAPASYTITAEGVVVV